MENTLLIVLSYLIAFTMAFSSKMIEISSSYGSYFQFIKYSPRTFLYCGTYGIIGLGGYWIYKNNVNPELIDFSSIELNNEVLVIVLSAMIIGWSAKGFSDTPLVPYNYKSENENKPNANLKLATFINFLFADNDTQYDLIITRKQKDFFRNKQEKFTADGFNKKDFEKRVYEFLDVHPKYGGGGDNERIAKFNMIMQRLVEQGDLESSMRYIYRNLGYKVFKEILK